MVSVGCQFDCPEMSKMVEKTVCRGFSRVQWYETQMGKRSTLNLGNILTEKGSQHVVAGKPFSFWVFMSSTADVGFQFLRHFTVHWPRRFQPSSMGLGLRRQPASCLETKSTVHSRMYVNSHSVEFQGPAMWAPINPFLQHLHTFCCFHSSKESYLMHPVIISSRWWRRVKRICPACLRPSMHPQLVELRFKSKPEKKVEWEWHP